MDSPFMKAFVFLLIACAVSFTAPGVQARGGHSGGTVHVRGYTRKDGTQVRSYDRAPPKHSKAIGSGALNFEPRGDSVELPSISAEDGVHSQPEKSRPPVREIDFEALDRRVLESQRKYAQNGYPTAQFDLGIRFLDGRGVEQNRDLAIHWLQESSKNGGTAATQKLRDLGVLKPDWSIDNNFNLNRIDTTNGVKIAIVNGVAFRVNDVAEVPEGAGKVRLKCLSIAETSAELGLMGAPWIYTLRSSK
jgi:hypothetical protein